MNKPLLFTTIFCGALAILFLLWLTAITTFNPITDKAKIQSVYSIIAKLEQYESTTPIADSGFERYFDYIDLTDEEVLMIEPRGVHFVRQGNSYLAMVPTGFDTIQYYDRAQDCWYGHKEIIGLKECKD